MKNTRSVPLEHGCYYHIYNRGNNGEQLFYTPENYYHFLRLYEKYIDPIADTYAWCLMGNHFHLLVRIKEEKEIGCFVNFDTSRSVDSGRSKWNFSNNPPGSVRPGGVSTGKKPTLHRMFSHFFNAYAKYINLNEGRTGSLFEKSFHRIPITSDKYFQSLVVYIHRNPVHHGFTDDFRDYPWSSYGSIMSDKPTKLKRSEVLEWFDNRKNFNHCHSILSDFDSVSHFIID